MKILMVCLGNICRSPLAEGIMKHKIQAHNLDWKIDSAGTNGYHTGQAPHRLSQKVAAENGIDISKQKARNFTPQDFENFDIIYAMATDVIDDIKWIAGKNFNAQKIKLLMDEVYVDKKVDVPDPWYGPEPGYHEVYKMIDKACDNIIKKYAAQKIK
jgi:protein-tyrosine phosphatase